MSLVIFEDDRWADFLPLSSTRHLGQQIFGNATIVKEVTSRAGDAVSLWGRDYLAETAREETQLPYNEPFEGTVLAINARINPLVAFEKIAEGKSDFALLDGDGVAMATLSAKKFEGALSPDGTMRRRSLFSLARGLERLETEDPVLFRYPWQMLALNGVALEAKGRRRGRAKLTISPEAEVEEFVTFDTSAGPIAVADKARIESFSRISGPCYIGPKTVLGSALVRGGTTIGEDCRIGGEVGHSVIYPHSNKAHSGYLGHSVVGEWVNVGAESAMSDLKRTYGTVRVQRRSGTVDSGLQKLGTMIGDMAKVSIGTMVYAGKTLGVAAHCSGLVDRDVPDFISYNGWDGETVKLELDSVSRTSERMMARRGTSPTAGRKALIERLYAESGQAGSVKRKRT